MKYIPERYGEINLLARKGIECDHFANVIIKAACDLSGLQEREIRGKCRKSRLCMVRFAIWVVMKGRGYGNDEIGLAFRRDRSTVLFGLKKAQSFIANHPAFVKFLELLRAETESNLIDEKTLV